MTQRKKKRVLLPNPPVKPQPTINSKELTCFITYSIGCIALQKLTFELQDYWNRDGDKFVIFDQSTFEETLQKYDWGTIVLHRGGTHNWNTENTPKLMALLNMQKSKGARLVYYIDDFLMHMNNSSPLHLMEICDIVIAKGYFLPDYLSKSEGVKNVVPLKTWINLNVFDSKENVATDFRRDFNILWFSAGRTGLGFLPSVLKDLNATDWNDAELHIIGSQAALYRAHLNKYRGIHKAYSEKVGIGTLYSLVKGSDVIINPLHPETDNAELVQIPAHKAFFNNAKVEIKFIISGAGRKPLITCHSRAYEECIKHGKDGYITDDPKEWVSILEKLKASRNIRNRIGNAARAKVEKEYDAKDRWPEIRRLILG